MPDYYELLGVARDAPTSEIKEAYRALIDQARGDAPAGKKASTVTADPAELNQAWNVLADPFQRRRYDEQLCTQEREADPDAAPQGTPGRAPGRRAPLAKSAEATEEAEPPPPPRGLRGLLLGDPQARDRTRSQSRARPTRAERVQRAQQPVELDGGLVAAPTRNRVNALAVDLIVIYVLAFLVLPLAFVGMRDDVYVVYRAGKQVGSTHAITRDASSQKARLLADEQARVARDTKPGKKPDKVEVKREQAFSAGTLGIVYGASTVLALALVVPASALTGQTLGKRIFKIRLVRMDGSPPGWGPSLLHYGLPIIVAIALALEIGPIGEVLALLLVLWFTRDPRRQGVHDKLAKTYVVTA